MELEFQDIRAEVKGIMVSSIIFIYLWFHDLMMVFHPRIF